MTRYKFRAEVIGDVETLQELLGAYANNWQIEKWIHQGVEMEDVTVKFDSVFSLEDIRQSMREVEDGQVMLQTLTTADNYTGERDYGIE
jgi:hypothetical protein